MPVDLTRAELLDELAAHLRRHLLEGYVVRVTSADLELTFQAEKLAEVLDDPAADESELLATRGDEAVVLDNTLLRTLRGRLRDLPRPPLTVDQVAAMAARVGRWQRGTSRERRPTARRTVRAGASRDGPPRSSDDPDDLVEIAVAGRGPAALLEGLRWLGPLSGLIHVSVEHDQGCPALGRSMRACTCEIVRLRARRPAA